MSRIRFIIEVSAGAVVLMALLLCMTLAQAHGECSRGMTAMVEIGGERFELEIVADSAAQERGLGGRSVIAARGGMIFVFAEAEPQGFVMRDCGVPIDLVYVDDQGRVSACFAMTPEAVRGASEMDEAYGARLKAYASETPVWIAIELRGGTLAALRVKKGDPVELDAELLRRLVVERGCAGAESSLWQER